MKDKPQKAGIIGAGIAGLAAAIRLAARGYKVEVFEANSYPGGKLSEFEQDGYRFDAGPSLFTMPQYVEDLFELAGEARSDFAYEKLPIVCHYFWEDGKQVLAHAAIDDFDQEVAQVFGLTKGSLKKFLKRSEQKYNLTGSTFLEKSLHRFSTWTTGAVARSLLHFPSLDIFSSMHRVHQRATGHPQVTQLLDRFATYNGSNPYKASGMLSMIPHFEHGIGAFFPKGGMSSITDELVRLGEKLGVQYFYNSPVEEITFNEKKCTGLIVKGQQKSFDKVVSNMDVYFTYKKLIKGKPVPKRIATQERSTSALIFYWGVKRSSPELGLHNILFSKDYKTEFDALANQSVAEDPTVYINISSKLSSSDAPQGCENWFTMINVPFAGQIAWEELIPIIRQRSLDKIKRTLGFDLEPLIETESILDPRSIEQKTSSYQGALYGTSSNTLLSAFLRHANYSSQLKNLYFCGGSVHPGGGIPLCLLSAKIVDDLIRDGY